MSNYDCYYQGIDGLEHYEGFIDTTYEDVKELLVFMEERGASIICCYDMDSGESVQLPGIA